VLETLRHWAKALKAQLTILAFAARDPGTPLVAKIVAGVTLAYALSPIDLIPDFIPVFGLLDDLILLPLGIWAALRLIPAQLRLEFARLATEQTFGATSRIAATVIVVIWIMSAVLLWHWLRIGDIFRSQ
jgi:uncharacterized membrane protein YkvA (DUF1232 family)